MQIEVWEGVELVIDRGVRRASIIIAVVVLSLSIAACGDGASGGDGRPDGGGSSASCEPGYDPCVPTYPPDVDCPDVDGPVSVSGSDPHGLDADRDGVGCEPYP